MALSCMVPLPPSTGTLTRVSRKQGLYWAFYGFTSTCLGLEDGVRTSGATAYRSGLRIDPVGKAAARGRREVERWFAIA